MIIRGITTKKILLILGAITLILAGLFLYFDSALTQVGATTINIAPPGGVPSDPPEATLQKSLVLAFGILGGISLIVIVFQGLRFVLSSGNPEKTTQARNGIIYALVGLTVALAGSSITHFALNYFNPSGEIEIVGANNILVKIAYLITVIVGIISVFMIVIAGMRYILSSGNVEQANSARNTIIYAIIGLVIAIVAGPLIALMINLLT